MLDWKCMAMVHGGNGLNLYWCIGCTNLSGVTAI